ncbi:MAG: universal stress protein [Chitinophagaceae bacterium]
MRSFIVPTDFSQNAQHASAYALQLAKQLHTKVILMHAFEEPVSVSEYEISNVQFYNMKDHILKRLEDMKEDLESRFGNDVPIELAVFNNDLVGNIKILYDDPDARLIVIGLTGAGMANFFLGSNTLKIVNNIERAVLTVPPYANFRPVKKIVFATDMWNVAETVPAKRIKRIVELLQAELLVLSIQKPQQPSPELEAEKEMLAKKLQGLPYTFHEISKRNRVTGIKDFAREQKADLIAIVPEKYDFLENLLKTNHTKAMLFKSGIPILTLPPEK